MFASSHIVESRTFYLADKKVEFANILLLHVRSSGRRTKRRRMDEGKKGEISPTTKSIFCHLGRDREGKKKERRYQIYSRTDGRPTSSSSCVVERYTVHIISTFFFLFFFHGLAEKERKREGASRTRLQKQSALYFRRYLLFGSVWDIVRK